MLTEIEYRKLIQDLFKKIFAAFDAVDPDLVECEDSNGAVTLQFADGSKCILSTQPSVRQLWVAVAAKGIAVHFNYDPSTNTWIDDKNQGLEFNKFLIKLVFEKTNLVIKL